MIKKLTAIIISILMMSAYLPTYAYELPHSFWALNDSYDTSLQAKDYPKIAEYGSQIVDLISAEPSNEQTDNIVGSRAYETAFAYYFIGDYANAAKYFGIYAPYGRKLGWTDGVRIAEEFQKQLLSSLELYKQTSQNQKYYGAKNEPDGVLYGQVSESSKSNESTILLYLEYGYSNEFDWANVIFKKARQEGKSIELALNFPNQGSDARTISASDSYISELKNILLQYGDVPVFLRIGAEVNIWGNQCTPDEFKNAFNSIANSVRYLPNVSVVWSVAHTDPWKSESRPYTSDDFYPGDDCVDYVGITIYCNKYFEGRRWEGVEKFNEICFKTGYSSDPVLMIKDFVDKYGDRKPIIISECGAAYSTKGEVSEIHHDWAATKLKEIYSYIPMVYPQVKLIAYFNKKIDHEANWYDLNSSSELTNAYTSVCKSPWLMQNNNTKSEVFFEHINNQLNIDGETKVSVYPRLYGADNITVDYYLNGQWLSSSKEAPYTVSLPDTSGTLRITATGNNGSVIDREYTVTSSGDKNALFYDINAINDNQKNSLTEVYNRGIITGYEDKTFRPNATITRAEFATMICRMMEYQSDELCSFDDAYDHWASKYINACTLTGAISGVGDNLFAPDENVTIEQAFKIVTVTKGMASANAAYPDGFISAATANGLTDNLTTQNFSSDLTRIDAASIIAQALK